MRILLIESDSEIAQSIELVLKKNGFNIYNIDLGKDGVDLAKLYYYDLIILELNLPDISGHDVIWQIRVSGIATPILVLSKLSDTENKVKSLGFGADDYMVKPFNKDELIARIHAIVRRSNGYSQSIISTGNIRLNLDTKQVHVDGERLHITGKEYQILELLSLRKGTVLTKEMFIDHLYGGIDEPEVRIIDVFIDKLRKKIAKVNGTESHIETVPGRGYVLRESEEELASANTSIFESNPTDIPLSGTAESSKK